MAVSMTFFANFSKRENSTKQPSGGTTYNIVFKDGFSISGGSVILNIAFSTASTYTEALYDNKYYFVEEVKTISNNITEIVLSIDVLATLKTSIAGYTGLMSRSPSNVNIELYVDNTIIPKKEFIVSHLDQTFSTQGNYCFQVICDNTAGYQAYFLDSTAYHDFIGRVGSEGDGDVSSKAYFNYIKSVQILPFDITKITGGNNLNGHLYIAYNKDLGADTALGGTVIGISVIGASSIYDYNLSIAAIPSYYSDARKYSNSYTKLNCILGGKVIALDANTLRYEDLNIVLSLGNTDLKLEVSIYGVTHDTMGGTLDHDLLVRDYLDVGVGLALCGGKDNTSRFLTSLNAWDARVDTVKSAAKIVGAGLALGGIGGAVASIGVAAIKMQTDNLNITQKENEANMEAYSCRAVGGSYFSANRALMMRFEVLQFKSTDKNPGKFGYPYYEITNINTVEAARSSITHNGYYYQFADASFYDAMIPYIKNKVNEFLLNGFYYE